MTSDSRIVALTLALALGLAPTSFAQDPNVLGAGRWEVSAIPGGGIFFTGGDTSGAPDFGEYGLGGAFTFNVNRFIGIEGEVGAGLSVDQDLRLGNTTLSNAKVPYSLAYNGSVICVAAGCPGRIPHDLRRTTIRNMVRRGLFERVAMTLAGHKTRSVFERYNIVSDGDLRAAAAKLQGLTGTEKGQSGSLSTAAESESSRIAK